MAYGESPILVTSFPTAIDLSAKIYAPVVLSSGLLVLAAAGTRATGFLQNKPDGTSANAGDGKEGSVMALGYTRVVCGAAIAEGAKVQADGSGGVITALATDVPLGETVEAGAASGDVITILITPGLPVL